MKYWVFINDNISGPFSIEEINSKKYLSKDLLLCPSEADGIAPSNWYFAKELPEFEKYLIESNIAVENNFDVDEIINSVYLEANPLSNKTDNADYDGLIIENNVLKEKLNIKEKENRDYKNKIKFLEVRINEIQKNLDSTLDLIKKYEEKLTSKDKEIERLSSEIEEIKKSKDKLEYVKKNEMVLNEKKDISSRDLEIKEELNNEETREVAVNESIKEDAKLPVKEETIGVEGLNNEVRKDVNPQSFEKTEIKIKEENISEIEKDLFDPFSLPSKKLNSVELETSLINNPESNFSDLNIAEKNLSRAPIEKDDSIFQLADIKLETVKSNLDLVENKNIEVVSSSIEESQKETNTVENSNLKLNETLQNAVFEQTLKNEVKNDIEKVDEIDKKEENQKTISEIKEDAIVQKEQIQQVVIEKEEIKNITKANKSDNKKVDDNPKERVADAKYSQRKTIKPVFKFTAILGFIFIFAFSIIFILRSGSNTESENKIIIKPKFPGESVDYAGQKSTSSITDASITQSQNLDVAKINENVRRSMDIVKNFELGNGKGKIQSWFSNNFSASNQVKEEWNATFLSGNLFVVQYRVLRYKQEPIVYLFEVDVEKNKIVRGINNNAIELLSDTQTRKKVITKPKINSKKIAENIEKDDEMF